MTVQALITFTDRLDRVRKEGDVFRISCQAYALQLIVQKKVQKVSE